MASSLLLPGKLSAPKLRIWSPGCSPASAAAEPGVTSTICRGVGTGRLSMIRASSMPMAKKITTVMRMLARIPPV